MPVSPNSLSLLAGFGHAPTSRDKLSIVTTTPILADLTRQVAGDRATVTSMVPSGADPHTYEPSLRDVRTVVYSRVALSNYLMLEPSCGHQDHRLFPTYGMPGRH
jgi:ABC-type Zn uptake system ZnuABC Zn-binding protein ZnuA